MTLLNKNIALRFIELYPLTKTLYLVYNAFCINVQDYKEVEFWLKQNRSMIIQVYKS